LGWGGNDSLLAVNAQARACIEEMHCGGLIVMGRNVQAQTKPLPPMNPGAIKAMLDEAQGMAQIPLLVATDQEGGRVARFGSAPFTPMPPAMAFGLHSHPPLATYCARATARELAAVGVNWNFAPVADVNSNADNPVIGDRAFGPTPQQVTPFVEAQIKGYSQGGVLPCVKHFPGHGDTNTDSHFDLPVLNFTLDAMERRELVPFQAAIKAGVPTVMTAHILFPAVDANGLPATMSHAILTGLLREQLGFDGLIVTDCLEMKAVTNQWGTARAAVLAAIAGADMLLVCHTLDRQRETYHALLQAVHSGELPRARVEEAASRVLESKRKVAAFGPPPLSVIGQETHRQLAEKAGAVASSGPTTLGAEAPV
jgi:beta-N-acetylhexosaminidase